MIEMDSPSCSPQLSVEGLLENLVARTAQQAEIVALGRAALAGVDTSTLFDRTVKFLLEVLPVDFAKVLQFRSDRTLLLRSGAGWKPGLVGVAIVECDKRSQAGYTLLSEAPVVVDDLASETRFSPNFLLRDHEIVSGMSVVIQGHGKPYGILGAHSSQRRRFSSDDVNCLQAAANVLAEAIRREATENALKEARDCERRLRKEIQGYSVELRHAHERERHRVARELHDEVGQTLTALNYTLERMALHSSGTSIEIAAEASLLVADLMSRISDLCLTLRPHVLDDFGAGACADLAYPAL